MSATPSSALPFIIRPFDPEDPAALRLLGLSDNYLGSLYPAESNYLESAAALKRPGVTFLGGFFDEVLVACGAVKIVDDDGRYGEIKRMFVDQLYRGRGLSIRIMLELEGHLRRAGIRIARLETGTRQPAALALYRKLGYVERGPFGSYVAGTLNVFMEKILEEGVETGLRSY